MDTINELYAIQMRPEETYQQLLTRIQELTVICKRKEWSITQKPIIKRPASDRLIRKIQHQIGQTIPEDLKTLFRMSRQVEFGYQFDETLSEEFSQNFSGEISWSLKDLPKQMKDFKDWIDAFLDPEYNDLTEIEKYREEWKNMIPFIQVPNGDIIAVNLDPSEVIYFSHEGDNMHGKVLGKSLWEFLDFYSKVGFAGSEDWQLEPFFDFGKNEMITQGQKVERFINLLNT